MGVMLQTFHWDCPREDKREFQWWKYINEQIPSLAKVGFTPLWLPPIHKAANLGGPSMGYDPYDYYDLGEFDQKGSIPTWFGTRKELETLIANAHKHRLSVVADIVINHNSGADVQEVNPITGQSRWTRPLLRRPAWIRRLRAEVTFALSGGAMFLRPAVEALY